MGERPIQTFQTRLLLNDEQSEVLDRYAQLYGQLERCLFADIQAGIDKNQLKREYLSRFQITARQFNAVRISLEGKIDSIKSRRPELISQAKAKIKSVGKAIAKLTCKAKAQKVKSPTAPSLIPAKIHQKKRRLHILQTRLASLEADEHAGKVRLCFGSRRLFHAQFDLKANGYASHDEWKNDWLAERSSSFFVLGSKDEVAGCQGCQAVVQLDGSLELTLRLPDALAGTKASRLTLSGVRFAYGQSHILAALNSSERIAATTKKGKSIVKRTGIALSYRFVRDDKGWRVFVSCQATPVAVKTNALLGAIGVDVNADHLAVAETDRFGNLVATRRIELHTYGASTNQAKAMIGDAAVAIGKLASKAGKPLVIEALDFQKKKADLDKSGANGKKSKKARMLSSFAYNKIASSMDAAAYRAGVEVIKVNPAYTSVIGAVNHAQRKGISIHLGAALAIARRGLGLREKAAVHTGLVPAANGGHVTFELPARNRLKHVWSFWSKTRTNLKAAHAAHYRCGDYERPPPPLTPEMRSLCATRYSTAKLRGASHQQHCSADALDDVP